MGHLLDGISHVHDDSGTNIWKPGGEKKLKPGGFNLVSILNKMIIDLVSIFRCSSSAHNRVHARHVDSSNLVF